MPFPVNVGSTTFTESQFTGQGYATALLDIVASVGSYVARLPYASSTSTITMAVSSFNLTVQTGRFFYPDQRVRLYNSVGNYMDCTILAWNDSTGAMTVSCQRVVGSGTYSVWYVSPLGQAYASSATSIPIPLSAGGLPIYKLSELPRLERSGIPLALEMFDYSFFMKPAESNFLTPLDLDNPYPFYLKTSGTGSVVSNANSVASITGNYAGLWGLSVSSPDDVVMLSYGRDTFIALDEESGDLDYELRLYGPTITAGETVDFKVGLTSLPYDSDLDPFSSFSFGFKSEYDSVNDLIKVFAVANNGITVNTKFLFSSASNTVKNLHLRYSASDKTVRFGVSDEEVRNPTSDIFIVSLREFLDKVLKSGSALKVSTLLKPFFYATKDKGGTGVATRAVYLDFFCVTRACRRNEIYQYS